MILLGQNLHSIACSTFVLIFSSVCVTLYGSTKLISVTWQLSTGSVTSALQWHVVTICVVEKSVKEMANEYWSFQHFRDADFPLFLARSILIFHLSLSELCLFLCSFSVRRHAHVDFQLFLQKSSGIPGICSSCYLRILWSLLKVRKSCLQWDRAEIESAVVMKSLFVCHV